MRTPQAKEVHGPMETTPATRTTAGAAPRAARAIRTGALPAPSVILLAGLLGLFGLSAAPAGAEEEAEAPAPAEAPTESEEAGSAQAEPGEAAEPSAGPVKNGFDLAGSLVPPEKIIDGGPRRDQIRSVDEPGFVEPGEATWVAPENPVLGVEIDGEARVYPVHVLEFHQIVNDEVGGKPIAVALDPLTGTPRVYERRVGDRTLTFGVSGLIHNSSFLMYDRETESLWLHFTGRAIDGPLAGRQLEGIRVRQEPFGRWLGRAPQSLVLERPAPKKIDYRYSPFSSYWVKDEIPFPVEATDRSYHAKELVVGVVADGVTKAYLGSTLTAAGGQAVDQVAGHEIRVVYSSELGVFEWEAPEEVKVTEAYWFAWKAFHPDTEIWKAPTEADAGATAATRRTPAGD